MSDINLRRFCDSLTKAVPGVLLTSSAINIASSLPLGTSIATGLYTIASTITVAKLAKMVFTSQRWDESTKRTTLEWGIGIVYSSIHVSFMSVACGVVSSVALGILFSATCSIMVIAGTGGPMLISSSALNLLTHSEPPSWSEILQ